MTPGPGDLRRADYPRTLKRVAKPVLQAIARDRRRVSKRLKPLLDAIVEMIFDHDLDLDRIAMAAGLDGSEVRRLLVELSNELGRPVWSYLRDHRLEVAARLLLETPIALLEIGKMVGYTSPSSFRQLMRDFLGVSASQYRRRAPRILERGGPPPAGSDREEYWQRMLAGELSDDEARALDAYLERLAPDSTPEAPADDEGDRFRRLRGKLADGLVDTLEHLGFADRRRFARDAVWFPDDTFFQHLSRHSREASAEEPERGVEWALLGIDSLAANQTFELETDPGLALLGWARLALARWRAGDLAGAEKDVEQATREAARAFGHPCPDVWKAEACRVVAAFDWRQGRWLRALALAEPLVALHRAVGPEALRRALLLRAELRAAAADLEAVDPPAEASDVETETRARLEAALADVEEALDLQDDTDEDETAAVVGLWSRILVLLGDRAEMAVALAQARRRTTPAGELEAAILLWLEGHAAAAPESPWRQARERFAALGARPSHILSDDSRRLEPSVGSAKRDQHSEGGAGPRKSSRRLEFLGATRIDLDLARLHLGAGRTGRASVRAADVAARLGALVTAPEDSAAVKALGRAASPAGEVTSAHLDRVEGVLKRLEWQRRATDRALRLAL